MNIKLSAKLIASHLLLGVAALLSISGIFWFISSKALRHVGSQGADAVERAAYEQLEMMCSIKEKQLLAAFKALEKQLHLVNSSPWLTEAAKSFNQSFTAADNSASSVSWQNAAKIYDPLFRDVCLSLDWQDMFLISTTGHVVYSMNKGADLGLSLNREPLRSSPLGKAFTELRANPGVETEFGDFAPYPPLRNAPASFLITRVKDKDMVIAYLAFQLSPNLINGIMETALGKEHSLESYVVGQDSHMRSDSLLNPNHHSVAASFMQGNKVTTEAVRNALAGKSGAGIIDDYLGNRVLSSWSPLEVFDTRWALVCEIGEAEAMKDRGLMDGTTSEAEMKMVTCGSAALLVTIAMMALIASYIARSISRPIKNAARVAEAIASGDFSQRLNMRRRDEIGLMADALDHMAEKVSVSLWHKTGVAELASQMRGKIDMQELAHSIAACLSKHLGAQAAALYLADKRGENLTLTGSYAFSRRKRLNAQIKLGEGIAGQAAREQSIITVSDLPDDYIPISSALGETAPRCVLAAPFTYEGKLAGVLEFSSLRTFSGAAISFLDDVLESVAVAFATAQSRQVQELLEETQRQAEELRTNNEKLESQAEELQVMQAELEISNASLERRSEDLTGQKQQLEQRNAELLKVREELEKRSKALSLASKYKSEFLANMSHELRTPMNSLLLLARSLSSNREGNLSKNQQEAAGIIVESGEELLNLIDEILDLAKIEAGRVTKHVAEVVLADVADNAKAMFRHMAAAKGLQFEVSVAHELPASIASDRARLEQIIKNFISNSLKFTEQGSITLSFARTPTGTELRTKGLVPEESIAISVADTGIGIPPDKQDIIFEAFQQADGSTARKYGGTGLGLSISRELATLLGGEIHLRSEPGQGAVFTLYLPLRDKDALLSDDAASTAPIAEPQAQPVPTVRSENATSNEMERLMLIIEDDPELSLLLIEQCRERGFKLLAAASGERGLELAELHQPMGIMLDMRLPTMDAWAALTHLKVHPKTRRIPVYVIAPAEDCAEVMRHGAAGVLVNPEDPALLDEALNHFETVIASRIKRLLVVEDDDVLRAALLELVRSEDTVAKAAKTGEEVHSLLRGQRFDCMVLDLGLPDCSGLELLRRLATEKNLNVPPVIIYSDKELNREDEQELRKYAESIIIKNARSKDRLLDEISLILNRSRRLPSSPQGGDAAGLYDQEGIFLGKRVLVVDDDMRNIFALSGILEGKGLQVLVAEDGKKALKALAEAGSVDLVLMDIMMPEMDGYETTRRIREQPEFSDLPVIALTAKAMKEDRTKCLEAGASDYLAKPVDLERLLSMMRVWLYK
uniref:response regulator n=1 Tax=Candidatus Electronema sp. TaxID=2698783 RepID=UPI004055FCB2